jgi:hypothetical protein
VTLPKEEVLDRESRWLRPAGIVALVGVALFAAGVILQQTGIESTDTDAEQLEQFHAHGGILIASQSLQALAVALFAFPLYVLFKAAQARAERMRGIFVGFCLIGPVLFAIGMVVIAVGIKDAAGEFVEQAPAIEREAAQKPSEGESADEAVEQTREDLAEDVSDDSGVLRTARSLQIPGILAMLIALVYTSMWSLRTGLLTRFWGSLGMALGVGLLLLGSFGLLLVVVWFGVLGFRFAGISRKGLPPAWAAGEAVPWEPPGGVQQPGEEQGGEDDPVEGSGRELSEPALPDAEDEPEEPDQPRKKRKRRE